MTQLTIGLTWNIYYLFIYGAEALKLEKVTYAYNNYKKALDNLTLTIPKNKYVGIGKQLFAIFILPF